MRVGVLGTGFVGRTISAATVDAGQEAMIGTRDPAGLMARQSQPGGWGPPPFSEWHAGHAAVLVGTFAEAAAHGEILFNATAGDATMAALDQAGAERLEGKVLIDVSNPLDFSAGMPPTLSVSNTDSLGERIQRAYPGAKVVKSLNTVNAGIMVDPGALAGGDHHVFVSGDDSEAKEQVQRILREWFGWRHIIDLGDISTARGAEMWLPLWLRLMGAMGTASFNLKIVT
jgi:predicted dinucleotide-binding enzyme